MEPPQKSLQGRPVPIHQLSVRNAFDGLTVKEKLYAHHMSKAAWSGARIILRQVSPEANDVFDLIMELHKCCQARFSGRWADIGAALNVSTEEVDAFLNFAANFLSNVGNYYGSGDQKIFPCLYKQSLQSLASVSERASILFENVSTPLFAEQPSSLGYPGEHTQSAYYPGSLRVTAEELAYVSHAMETNDILPENTRVRKIEEHGQTVFEVLQASVERNTQDQRLVSSNGTRSVRLLKGDHV